MFRSLAYALALSLALATASAPQPVYAAPSKAEQKHRKQLTKRAAAAHRAAARFADLADEPAPAGLTSEQQQIWARQSAFFVERSKRLGAIANAAEELLAKLDAGEAELAAMNMQFAQQYGEIEHESRTFRTLANAAASRHEEAMAAIGNMK
jgi:hypothetical protein